MKPCTSIGYQSRRVGILSDIYIPHIKMDSSCHFYRTHRVQVPLARGSVMPEIASIREDFPALCHPIAAIAGISRSTSTLQDRYVTR